MSLAGRCIPAATRAPWLALVAALGLAATGASSAAADPLASGPLMREVRAYAKLGVDGHWVGTPAEERTLGWLRRALGRSGLTVGTDGVSFYAFRPRSWRLTVSGREVSSTAPYFYSGSTGPRSVTAQLVYAGRGTPADLARTDVKGRIAVIDVPYLEDFADPTFTGQGKLPSALSGIQAAGAVGLVAVTEGPQDYPVNQDSTSLLGTQHLPTLFVGKHSGAPVIAAAKAQRGGSVLLDARPGRACTQNLWAVIPGRDAHRYVVVATPTSGFDEAASERGAGVAILLGLARHYASLPIAERPLTIVFAVLSGHEIGVGAPTFVQMHPDWFGGATDAFVGLGASIAAQQLYELPDGTVQRFPFGDLSRALYVSENPLLEPIAERAFAAAQPLGSIPPGGFDPGEQQLAYAAGVPIVAISGASYYFHTAGDTPAGVAPDLLAVSAKAFMDVVDGVGALPPGAVRQGNVLAGAAGTQKTAKVSSPDPRFAPAPDPGCAQIDGGG